MTLEPGYYDGIAEADYFALPYASKSLLWTLRESPAHARAYLDGERKTSPEMVFGSAFDCLVFDGPEFAKRYVISQNCQSKVKSGDRKGEPCGNASRGMIGGEWRCGQHTGGSQFDDITRTVLTADEAAKMAAMHTSIRQHPYASKLLLGEGGHSQRTIIWDDEATGMRCKARIDRHCGFNESQGKAISTHVDLKTTFDAAPWTFRRQSRRYGYHVQAAHYLDGCNVLHEADRRFLIVAVEKEPDYSILHRVEIFEFMPDLLGEGLAIRDTLLRELQTCQQTNQWPGRTPEIHEIGL